MNTVPPQSNLELFHACAAGDHRAQAELSHRFGPDIGRWIRQTAWRRGIHLQASDVDDLRQDVLARLLADDCRRLAGFDGRNGCQPHSWLRVVTTRLTLNHLCRGRRRMVPLDDAPPVVDDAPDAIERLIEQADARRRARLWAAVDELAPADRTLLSLYLDHQLAAGDIAARLRISVGAVYTRKNRLITRLRSLVQRREISHRRRAA